MKFLRKSRPRPLVACYSICEPPYQTEDQKQMARDCAAYITHLVVKPLYSTETNEGTPTTLAKINKLIHFVNNSTHNKAQWKLSDLTSNTLKSANEMRWGSTDTMIKSVLRDVNKFDTFVISIVTDPKNTEAIRNKCRALLPTREDYAELQYLDRLLDKFRALQKLCQGACDFISSC
jgi:hypothetical protein